MKKDIEWLKNEVNELPLRFLGFSMLKQREEFTVVKDDVLELINQLDEPEVLSQKWIDEHVVYADVRGGTQAFIHVDDLQNLLVPKQEEVDRAYKDGYEKGKQHTFYKGYLEGLADKEKEPETVADVVSTFWKSFERLKEVMSMEVEELEE